MLVIEFEITIETTKVETLVGVLDTAVEPRFLPDFAPTDRLILDRAPAECIESFDIGCGEVRIRCTVFVDEAVESDQPILNPMIVEIEPTLLV